MLPYLLNARFQKINVYSNHCGIVFLASYKLTKGSVFKIVFAVEIASVSVYPNTLTSYFVIQMTLVDRDKI